MKLNEITKVLEQIAPLELAEEWDNVGLLAGDYEQNIKRVMLTIDMTAEMLAEAKANRIDLMLAYHPPIWDAIKKVVAGQGASALLHEAIRANIAIYAMHTALDSVGGGVNDVLAEIVGIESPQVLDQSTPTTGKVCKLIVFVPEASIEKVSEAVFAAGAGKIGPDGRYSKCGFRCRGTGTFQCGAGSRPAIGKPGSFEQVDEYRLETIVPTGILPAVLKAMMDAHPYEEPAFDCVPLLGGQITTGLGRFGKLKEPTKIPKLIEKIKKTLKVKTVGLVGPKQGTVRSAAVCAGSCGSILQQAITNKCEFYLTGELKHHQAMELQAAGVTCVCVSHTNSERIILPRIAKIVRKKCPGLNVEVSRKDHDPFTWG